MIKGPEAWCRSYGEAMLNKDGRAIAGHYLYPYISFTLGQVHSFADRATADVACIRQIDGFERAGVGTDIRMTDFKVVAVSEGSALCHVTWTIAPANGVSGWSWTTSTATDAVAMKKDSSSTFRTMKSPNCSSVFPISSSFRSSPPKTGLGA